MNRYQPSTPRAAPGLIAIAMTAITVGVLVVLPAKFEATTAVPHDLASARGGDEGAVRVAVGPARSMSAAEAGRQVREYLGRAVLGEQAFRAKDQRSSSRRRASTWPVRSTVQYSDSRD